MSDTEKIYLQLQTQWRSIISKLLELVKHTSITLRTYKCLFDILKKYPMMA